MTVEPVSVGPVSVEIDHLTIRYGTHTVVRDFSASIPLGGWLGLIGPNGAGKSSVLRAVTSLVAFEGHVTIAPSPIGSNHAIGATKAVAYVPQRPMLPSGMSVIDYVTLGRSPHLSLFQMESAHDRRIVSEVIERLDLTAFARRRLGELSGGEAQRTVLARALAQQANVLVLDEPTSALDLGHAHHVLELVDELRTEDELTVLCAMHDLTAAGQFSDELALLVDGATIAKGAPSDVLQSASLEMAFGTTIQVVTDPHGGVVIATKRGEARRSAVQFVRPE